MSNLYSSSSTFSTEYNLYPNKYNSHSYTLEEIKGLNKALAAYSIIGKNCNIACTKALDISKKYQLQYGSETYAKLNSCINSCLLQRMKQHFPEENNIVDFVYSTAFAFSHVNQFHINSNNIANKEFNNKNQSNNLLDLLGVANSFDKYFS